MPVGRVTWSLDVIKRTHESDCISLPLMALSAAQTEDSLRGRTYAKFLPLLEPFVARTVVDFNERWGSTL